MGLCASKPEAAEAAPVPPPPAPPAPAIAATPAAAAAADEEETDVVATQLAGAPSAVPGAVDAASGPSSLGLLRGQQSVVGSLPVFTKTPSGRRGGVPLSDIPPAPTPLSPSASAAATAGSPAAPFTPAASAASAADAAGNGGGAPPLARLSKGYDPLERPSRSALRVGADGDGAVTPAAAPGGVGGAGPTPFSRKSIDSSSSVKFLGVPAAAAAVGATTAATAAATVSAAAVASPGSAPPPPAPAASLVDAEAADPQTAERRARLDAQSKTFSMRAVVDRFYEKVWADPLLRPFFERVDQEKLKRHQEAAFALAFGGQELLVTLEGAPGGAPPSDLRAIHRRQILEHGLAFEHFDAFIALFKETVGAIPAIPDEQRATAIQQLAATRPLFGPLMPEEREQEEAQRRQREQQGQRPSSGGGGRRKFILFGPRVGSAGGGGASGGGAAATAAAAPAVDGGAP